ncbi:MAG: DNA cytosine methyltransferase [Bacteroidota bacterium]
MSPFKFIDLFAGVGGMRIAFERNGGKCVFSSEWDRYCQKTYYKNFGDMPVGDITKIEAKDIPNHDILIGGFPCQPFSSIGKREGFEHPTQGTLFFDIVRILKEKKPASFLLENVSGLKHHDGGNTFRQIVETLQNELGYFVTTRELDAADYGVPQHRKRIYIVGFINKVQTQNNFSFEWPEKQKEKVGIGPFIESHADGYSISEHLQSSYIYKKDDGRPQVIDKNSNIQVKTLCSTYHKIQRLTGTFVKDGRTGLRLLSHNECKAIMGFPKDFKFPVSRTQMYRQMGNSVAIPVVQAIAKQMMEVLNYFSKNTVEQPNRSALTKNEYIAAV